MLPLKGNWEHARKPGFLSIFGAKCPPFFTGLDAKDFTSFSLMFDCSIQIVAYVSNIIVISDNIWCCCSAIGY